MSTKVIDGSGNSATSSTITVSGGAADTTPPDVQVTGVVYDGKKIPITASATDQQSASANVEFYVDSKLKTTDTSAAWSAKINAKALRCRKSFHSSQGL